MDSKLCSRCDQVKPVTEFTSDRSHADGLCSSCKDCRGALRRTPPEVRAERYRQRSLATFWRYANAGNPDDCWLWTGTILWTGYGHMHFSPGHQRMMAHRFSWIVHHGPIPDGLSCLHRCDVRNCVNPDHLFLGDHAANMQDMVRKGRGGVGLIMQSCPEKRARGTRIDRAKLDDEKVLEIRRRFADGEEMRSIARVYGVSGHCIGSVVHGHTWKHVPMP